MSSILFNRLGMEIPEEVLSANPGFANLLMAISQRIDSDGISKDIKEKANEMKSNLMKQKEAYFSKLILFDEVQSILLERKFNSETNESSDLLWDMFVDSNCKELLSTDGGNLNLFGLSEDSFTWKPEYKKMVESSIQMVLSKLESNLKDRCESISDVYKLREDGEFQLPTSTNLAQVIERDLKELKKLKAYLKEIQSKRLVLFNQYYDCLTKSARLLADITKIYRLKKIPENNKITIDWLVARCDGLCTKMRMMELQVLHETYSKDAVKALTVIKKELDKSSEETNKELKQVTALLNCYASLGDEFQEVVKEFRKVKEEIENRKWALGQLD